MGQIGEGILKKNKMKNKSTVRQEGPEVNYSETPVHNLNTVNNNADIHNNKCPKIVMLTMFSTKNCIRIT